jgi:hypothetical protein
MSVGVAVVHDDVRVLDEVAHALDRTEGVHLAGLGDHEDADVVLAGGEGLKTLRPGAAGVVVLSTGDPLVDARAGFALGAAGLMRWPEDVADLGRLVAAAASSRARASNAVRAPVVSVVGARGGAGTTTVACLLAFATPGALLVDFDFGGAGQLGYAQDGAGGSFERIAAAPLPDVVDTVAEPHAAGRAVLLPAGTAPPTDMIRDAVLDAARRSSPLVVVDAGRLPVDVATATRTVVVCADDVASLRSARAHIDAGHDVVLVLNRLRRRGLRAAHVARALGREPAAMLRPDRRIARAADLGVLPRRLQSIAKRLAKAVLP